MGKKQTGGAQKKIEKLVEDKTFGLKNKNKSKKVQQYVEQVAKVAAMKGRNARQIALDQAAKDAKKNAKKEKEEQDKELAGLFKAVTTVKQQEVGTDVDPKSVLCAFFKAGKCIRGNKCKFSHDLAQERKASKINVYADPRMENMQGWDQDKLETVIAEKHKRRPNETDIVCKYFLDAIEKQQYGWFWECPNGNDKCIYRHALPPGYKLKSEVKEEKKDDEIPFEEVIENERAALDPNKCTKVTLETFALWKERQKAKKAEELKAQIDSVARKQGGRNELSGRALFTFDPSLFVDDAEAEDAYEIKGDLDDVEEEKEAPLYGEDDGTATVEDASLFLGDDAVPSDDDDDDNNGEQQDDEDGEDDGDGGDDDNDGEKKQTDSQ